MADLQQLPKMEATIQETLRINPTGPLIFRANAQATRLRDYVIPKKCLVFLNVYYINYDTNNFPSGSTWNPKQWLGPQVAY